MTDIERFSEKVSPEPNTGCWLWDGAQLPKGYGRFWFRGKAGYAHRAAYEMFHCGIPDGMHVCHKCDTPECVNPAHLFLGTRSDNMRDAFAKGRGKTHDCRGIVHTGRRKLTDEERDAIRAVPLEYGTGRALAGKFGISPAMISRIRRGRVS
jgi:hypothetical protein